ncbi:hypothetical protein Adt_22872 [Abeliophyllum distichum]|uniref:Uncharacterized protein n=1 Tax=Abeliophyllum distichum TaxID=126358 RepID=A0ABD1S990_9LAMI
MKPCLILEGPRHPYTKAKPLRKGMATVGQSPISSIVLYWKGLVISTQGQSLFITAWHQLGKAQYLASSYIGRAIQKSLFPTRKSSSLNWDLVFVDAPSPHKGLSSSMRHGTSWDLKNFKWKNLISGLI